MFQNRHHAAAEKFGSIEEKLPVKGRVGLVQVLNQQLDNAVFDFDQEAIVFSRQDQKPHILLVQDQFVAQHPEEILQDPRVPGGLSGEPQIEDLADKIILYFSQNGIHAVKVAV